MSLGDGANKLYRDSKLGIAVNSAVTAVLAVVVDWLATLPGYVTALVAGGVGVVLNAITAYKAKRSSATDLTSS